MAARSDIKAGSAYVELLLRNKAFLRGLKKSSRRLRAFGRAAQRIGSLGIFGGGGGRFLGLFAGAGAVAALAFPIKLAANLETAQAQFETLTGSAQVAAQMISQLEQFAGIGLIPVEELQRGAQTLLGYGTAANKVVPSIKALAEISRGSGERFQRLTLALGQTFAKTRLFAQEVRQFVEAGLNPLQQITERTGETMKEVSERMAAGAVSAEEVAQALQAAVAPGGRFNGLLEKMGRTASGAFTKLLIGAKLAIRPLGQQLLPIIKSVLEKMLQLLPAFRAFVKENAQLIVKVAAAVAGLAALSAVVVGFGVAVQIAGFALGGIVSLLGLLLNPITLVVAAMTGLVTWFLLATETGQQMLASLSSGFADLKEIATATFGGIVDALASGQFALAGKIAMAGLNLAWLTGINDLSKKWLQFKDLFLRTTTEMVFGALGFWVNFSIRLQAVWAKLVTGAQLAGESIAHFLTRSSDPKLAADQDAAHLAAADAIRAKGEKRLLELINQEQRALDEIEATRQQAEEDRNREFNAEEARHKKRLEQAQAELDALLEQVKARQDGQEPGGSSTAAPLENLDLSGGSITQDVFASFSAAALAARGQGPGKDPGAEKVADQIKETGRVIIENIKEALAFLLNLGLNP